MASPDDLENLKLYCQLGFSIIPVVKDGKEALVKWAQYQNVAPTIEQVLEWANKFPDCRWAVITGKVSGVMVVDCDNDAALQAAEALGITSSASVKTPHGYHFYFRLPNDDKVRKSVSGHVSKGTYWPQVKGLDLRYEGGYAIISPSSGYEWQIEEETIEDELTVYPDWPGATYEEEAQPELIPAPPQINSFADLDLTNTSLESAGKTQNETEKKYKEIAEQYPTGKIPRGGSGIHDITYKFLAEELLLIGMGPELEAAGQKFMTDYFSAPLTDGRFETSLKTVKAKERQNHPERFDSNGNYTYHLNTKGIVSNLNKIQPSAAYLNAINGEEMAKFASDEHALQCWQSPWLPKESIVQVYGYSGHGKSMFLQHALHHAAKNLHCGPFERTGEKPKILYLDFENGKQTIGKRIDQLYKSFGSTEDNILYWTPWLNDEQLNLRDPAGIAQLLTMLQIVQPDILVIDTLRSAFPGLKENSAEEWSAINQLSLKIRNCGCTIVLVHHSNKPDKEGGMGREAGSSNQLTTLEVQLRVTQVFEDAELAKTRGGIYAGDLPENPFHYMRQQIKASAVLYMVFELSYGKVREWTDLHEPKQYMGLAQTKDGKTRICNSPSIRHRLSKDIRSGKYTLDQLIAKLQRPQSTLEKWADELNLTLPI